MNRVPFLRNGKIINNFFQKSFSHLTRYGLKYNNCNRMKIPAKSFLFGLLLIMSALRAIESSESRKNGTLSRKKRYLVFPEGSSLQLVYCLTVPIVSYHTIFTMGVTAALAWELPSDPRMFFRRPNKAIAIANRKDDKPSTGWATKENYAPTATKYKKVYNGQNDYKENYNYKVSANPAYYHNNVPTFTKYNTIHSAPYRQAINRKTIYRKPVYQKQPPSSYYQENDIYSDPIDAYMHPAYHHVHRRTRRDLYGKIEKFFKAQSKDGRACLLKSVCEVSQASGDKGTFMEEILKVIFRAKPHENYEDEDEYDRASNRIHNCTELYPTCQSSVWNII